MARKEASLVGTTAIVSRQGVRVGNIEQASQESIFAYSANYQPSSLPGEGIATTLPLEEGPFITPGKAQHPFFANLLPEGFRLEAIRHRRRLAAGDAFGLLLETGADTVGDIEVTANGKPSIPRETVRSFAEVSFQDWLELDLESPSAVAGVQPKLSAARLTFPVRLGGPSLIKLAPARFPGLIENEATILKMAQRCGIETVRNSVVQDRTGTKALLVARFDRTATGKRHVEDGCQLCNVYPESKYDLRMRDIVEAVRRVSMAPLLDTRRIFEQYLFGWIVGNNDLHAKNFSVVADTNGGLTLSPAYDIVSIFPYPGQTTRMALKMGSKDDAFTRADFQNFFSRYGLTERIINSSVDRIVGKITQSMDIWDEFLMDEKVTAKMKLKCQKHLDRLS